MNDAGETRTILADTVTRLFADMVTPELLRSSEQGEFPHNLWQAIEENGLSLPLVPEGAGGVGGDWRDAFEIFRAAGEYAAPLPLAETILGSWLLSRAGLTVPQGPLTVAPVEKESEFNLHRAGDGWRIDGEVKRVPWGRDAAAIVFVVPHEGTTIVAEVSAEEAEVERSANIAREPRDTIRFDNVPVASAAEAELPGDAVILYGALVRAGQMAGALDRLLAQSVEYANERKQFGRPIGKFQAIQQELAVLAGETAAAGIAARIACDAADARDLPDGPWFEIAAAKIRTGEAADRATRIAHQVHGAIGFTYEHTLHFATRRLWSWRAEFGAGTNWAEALGRRVASRGADQLWPDVTSRRAS